MTLVRIALERVLEALFRLARAGFAAFALATLAALLGGALLRGPEAPAWLGVLQRTSGWIAGIFVVAALLLCFPPRPRAAASPESEPPPWLWLLGAALALLPALAWARAAELLALWREIGALLDRSGFWDALTRSDPYAGLVLVPVAAALFVPALEAVAAFFLVAVPLALAALLPTRSHRFPRLLAMLVVSQAALVGASAIAADAFVRLAAEAASAMRSAGDAEVARSGEGLREAGVVLASTARAFVPPLLGYGACLLALLGSPRAAAFFRAGAEPAPGAPRPAAIPPSYSAPAYAPAPARERAGAARRAGAPQRSARTALVGLGALLLLFAGLEQARPRARYLGSEPAPGATLSAPPPAVRVRFGHALDPSSTLTFDRITPGEPAARIDAASRLEPRDAAQAELVMARPEAAAGVYRVSWLAVPAGGGVTRSGAFRFAVGMPLPASEPRLEERDVGWRAQRKIVAGGVALLVLGLLQPHLPRRR